MADHCISVTELYLYPFSGFKNFIPLNCDTISRGKCVRHVKRRQPVILCTRRTRTPSTIPQGKHVLNVSITKWYIRTTALSDQLHCSNGSCTQNYSHVYYRCHSNVSHSCLTINKAQEKEHHYYFTAHFTPPNVMMYKSGSIVHFHVTYEGTYASLYISFKLDNIILFFILVYVWDKIALISRYVF